MTSIFEKKKEPIREEDIMSNDKTIEIGGPEIFTHNEIVKLASNILGKEVKISYMPEWVRRMILWSARTFTSSKKYGPLEFFFTVLAMDMVAPAYGEQRLSDYFTEMKTKI